MRAPIFMLLLSPAALRRTFKHQRISHPFGVNNHCFRAQGRGGRSLTCNDDFTFGNASDGPCR